MADSLQLCDAREDAGWLRPLPQRGSEALGPARVGQSGQRLEGARLGDGQVTQHTSVQLHAALQQVVYERGVLHVLLSASRGQPLDPELPHAASLGLPSFTGVDERPADGAHRQTVAAVLPAAEMPRALQQLLDSPVPVRSAVPGPAGQREEHHDDRPE